MINKNIINHTNQNRMINTTFDHIYKKKIGSTKIYVSDSRFSLDTSTFINLTFSYK